MLSVLPLSSVFSSFMTVLGLFHPLCWALSGSWHCVNMLFNSGKCYWASPSTWPFTTPVFLFSGIVIWVWALRIHCRLLIILRAILQLWAFFFFLKVLNFNQFLRPPLLTCYSMGYLFFISKIICNFESFVSCKIFFFSVALASALHLPQIFGDL